MKKEALLEIPAWVHEYAEENPRAIGLWLIQQDEHRFCRPEDEMVERLGLRPDRARRVIEKGMGILWDRKGDKIQQRRPKRVRQQVFNRKGCAAKGVMYLPADFMTSKESDLKTLLSLPALVSPGETTAVAYTMKCQGISRSTVTRRRSRARRWGMLLQKAMYELTAAPKPGQKRPRNVFQRGRNWLKRLPDALQFPTCVMDDAKESDLLRKSSYSPKGRRELLSKLGKMIPNLVVVTSYYRYMVEKGPPQFVHKISHRMKRNLRKTRLRWILVESEKTLEERRRWEPNCGFIDPDLWARMLNKELHRIEKQINKYARIEREARQFGSAKNTRN